MIIHSHKVDLVQGYRNLSVETDLGRFIIPADQRLFDEFGLVFCGPSAEEVLPAVEIPDDRARGRMGWTARGFTDDPGIVSLYLATFRQDEDED